MKIGIYGGLFDPVHNGHVSVVRYVAEHFRLEEIFIVPVGVPSHRAAGGASAEDRLRMCRLTFENMAGIQVSDMEVRDKNPAYTWDTLCNFQRIYGTEHQWFEIIGEDSLAYFDQWKNYREILERCKLIVLRREGYHGTLRHKNIILTDSPSFPFSSTQIRALVREGREIRGMVPGAVLRYIEEKELYRD
jgi:nicotinate-nucleotide adenylyltransferase